MADVRERPMIRGRKEWNEPNTFAEVESEVDEDGELMVTLIFTSSLWDGEPNPIIFDAEGARMLAEILLESVNG